MLTHQSMSVAASPRERGAHWLAILVVVALIVTGLNMAGEDFSAKVDRCIGRSKIRRSLFTEFALLLLVSARSSVFFFSFFFFLFPNHRVFS